MKDFLALVSYSFFLLKNDKVDFILVTIIYIHLYSPYARMVDNAIQQTDSKQKH